MNRRLHPPDHARAKRRLDPITSWLIAILIVLGLIVIGAQIGMNKCL